MAVRRGASNGINADGSLMNVGNKLGDRPSIRLFTQYTHSSQMEEALSDNWIYGSGEDPAAKKPEGHAHPGGAGDGVPNKRAHHAGPEQARNWGARPAPVEPGGLGTIVDEGEEGWSLGDERTGLTPRAQHMQLGHDPLLGERSEPGGGAAAPPRRPATANQLIVQQNLWHAIRAGKRQMVKRAVEDDGANVMAPNPDDEGLTALHLASQLSKIGLLEYLLSLPRVDPNVKDARGRTPLDLASNADIRSLLGVREAPPVPPPQAAERKPPPPPGAPSWGPGAKAAAGGGGAPEAASREAMASAAEARAGVGAAAASVDAPAAGKKPWPRRARHGPDDPIVPPQAADDLGDGVDMAAALAARADAPATPVKLLEGQAGSVFSKLRNGGSKPAGGVLAAAAKTAATKPRREGPVTKNVFGDGVSRGSLGSQRSSGSSASGSGGEALDGDGFPVIEGPPR